MSLLWSGTFSFLSNNFNYYRLACELCLNISKPTSRPRSLLAGLVYFFWRFDGFHSGAHTSSYAVSVLCWSMYPMSIRSRDLAHLKYSQPRTATRNKRQDSWDSVSLQLWLRLEKINCQKQSKQNRSFWTNKQENIHTYDNSTILSKHWSFETPELSMWFSLFVESINSRSCDV